MSFERLPKRPIHLQLRDAIAQRIAAGEWDADTPLPSESALAREFGVSCCTVRTALDALERERAVVRRQGGGTFVADHHSTRRIGHECENFTIPPDMESVVLVEAWADEAERVRLCLRPTDRVYRIHRTCASNGKAFMAERISLPAALFPDLTERGFLAHRIVALAKAYSVRLGMAQERVSIGTASAAAAGALGLGEGWRVLVLDRVVMTSDGRPAEWRVAECNLTEEHLSALSRAAGNVA
jgi:GntR family transcriptional regulator